MRGHTGVWIKAVVVGLEMGKDIRYLFWDKDKVTQCPIGHAKFPPSWKLHFKEDIIQ